MSLQMIDLTQDVRRELQLKRRAPVLRGFRYGLVAGFLAAAILFGFLTWLTR